MSEIKEFIWDVYPNMVILHCFDAMSDKFHTALIIPTNNFEYVQYWKGVKYKKIWIR